MAKYKYEFVKIKAGVFSRKPAQDYHEVIQAKAKEGWRLVQIHSPSTTGYGAVGFYELIFEKEDNF